MIDSVSESAGGLGDLKKTRRRKPAADRLPLDRLPPHSVEMERGVLGCVLLAPTDCLALCIEKFKDGKEVFYDLRHQTLYAVMVEMHDQGESIDVLTLHQRLKDGRLLEQIGGIPYLNALQDAAPSAANAGYYADIVREKAMMRKVLAACRSVEGRVYDFQGDVTELMDEVEREMLSLQAGEYTGQKATKALVHHAISLIEEQWRRAGALSGVATGFPDFDRMTDGLHGGEMIVLAGRPSLGKTSLVMNIAEHVALTLKLPVGVFSLEMTAEELMKRVLCSSARVNLRTIRDGFMSESDFPKLTSAAGRWSAAPLHIDDTPGLSIMQLRSRARRMHQMHGLKLLAIDYLQLLHSTSQRAQENRQQEIAEISSGIKALAKELNLPILVASQLNREPEKRGPGGRPRMADLRESGAIEQDADLVGLIYRPGETNAEQEDESDGVPVNLLIAKQRNGPTGDVPLTFLKSYTRFESAAKVCEDDLP